jgi:hypothetical protein
MKEVTLGHVKYSGPLGSASYQPDADAYMPNELALEADGQISFLNENHNIMESPNGMGWITTKDGSLGWVRYCFPKSIFPQITVDLYLKQIVADAQVDAVAMDDAHALIGYLPYR